MRIEENRFFGPPPNKDILNVIYSPLTSRGGYLSVVGPIFGVAFQGVILEMSSSHLRSVCFIVTGGWMEVAYAAQMVCHNNSCSYARWTEDERYINSPHPLKSHPRASAR